MSREVAGTAKPSHIKRLRIIFVVGFCRRVGTAGAGLADQPAGVDRGDAFLPATILGAVVRLPHVVEVIDAPLFCGVLAWHQGRPRFDGAIVS